MLFGSRLFFSFFINFISKDKAFGLKPHIIVILGSNTFEIFNREIKKYLLKDKNIKWVCMPHPSARTVVNVWLSIASREIRERLMPIQDRPYKWFCNNRNNYGWEKA